MTPEPQPERAWARARELFLELADRSEADRSASLAALRGAEPEVVREVERLLAHDRGPGAAQGPPEPATRRFGPYETIRPIASGGMGEVLLARRVDGEFELQVAIKLLHGGAFGRGLVERFLRERQTLARLDHEYVARLLDGGTTEQGDPYLVMEYVEGRPLVRFAREERLDVRERLELFSMVVAAVEHAHSRGVIHRDLKPSNILVRADGKPRLLDFGIARAVVDEGTDPLTRTGQFLYTPQYAAPEQLRGETVSEASDLFALGVVLYELLADESPWGTTTPSATLERAILEQDPPPPSRARTGSMRRALAGDLDTIVLTCLAKEPDRRYASALDLRADLSRHLRGLPINARRTGPLRRGWSHLRRRPWLGALAAVGLVALVSIGAAWRFAATAEARREELFEAVDARLDTARDLRADGRYEDARAQLDAALESLAVLPEAAARRAEVLGQIAVLGNWTRDWDSTLRHAALGLELAPADEPRLTASLLNARSYAANRAGVGGAEALTREAVEFARARLAADDELRLDALLELGALQRTRGVLEAAEGTLAEAERAARLLGDSDLNLASVLTTRGLLLADLERWDDSIATLLEARDIFRHHHGTGHRSIALADGNLAESLRGAGRLEEAAAEWERALAIWRARDEPHYLILALAFSGRNAAARGDLDQARARLEEALELGLAGRGATNAMERRHSVWIGGVYERLGLDDEARVAYERALAPPEPVALDPAEQEAARAGLERLAARAR